MSRILGSVFWAICIGCVVALDYSIAAKDRAGYGFAEHAERRVAEAKAVFGLAVANQTAVPAAELAAPGGAETPQPTSAPSAGGTVSLLLRLINLQPKAPAQPEETGAKPSPAAMAAAAAKAFAAVSAALSGAPTGAAADAAPAPASDDAGASQIKPVGRFSDKACVMRAGQRHC